MSPTGLSNAALSRAIALGTVLQVTMVVAGHFTPAVAQLFAVLGMTLSLLAGVAYALWADPNPGPHPVRDGALGGAIAGGACALIGIAISFALGDVLAFLLVAGTISSMLTGAAGGAVTAALRRRRHNGNRS